MRVWRPEITRVFTLEPKAVIAMRFEQMFSSPCLTDIVLRITQIKVHQRRLAKKIVVAPAHNGGGGATTCRALNPGQISKSYVRYFYAISEPAKLSCPVIQPVKNKVRTAQFVLHTLSSHCDPFLLSDEVCSSRT